MQRVVECFYPGRNFPAISITGATCSLNCKHCSGKYLQSMIPATTPEELVEVADALAERGARGFLLSGGSDSSGRVPTADFSQAIKEIKRTTDLRINAHIGLSSTDEVERLVASGVDSFSVDIYGSDETIQEVLGLNATVGDYFRVVKDLTKTGAQVVPHLCVGIHGGELRGEYAAIERLKPLNPEKLVLISLIPTKGTPYEAVKPPSPEDVRSVIMKSKAELPMTRVLLGCMRSKLDRAAEYGIVQEGCDGIVLPSSTTVERLRNDGVIIRKRAECCALL